MVVCPGFAALHQGGAEVEAVSSARFGQQRRNVLRVLRSGRDILGDLAGLEAKERREAGQVGATFGSVLDLGFQGIRLGWIRV